MPRSAAEIPRRPFGTSGETVSILGLGGWHLGVPKTDRDAVRLVHEAIDAGINFLDNAWDYNDGVSESRMGKAIADRRDRVFLMTKLCTHGRDARTAMRQLEESLRRLRTDHLDLWQIHEVAFDDEPRRHFARGGAVEALDRARQQGKVQVRRLYRPQGSGAAPRDAGARLRVGQLSAAAQLLRRVVSQLRAARAARARAPRHRTDRHEELLRRRAGDQGKSRSRPPTRSATP